MPLHIPRIPLGNKFKTLLAVAVGSELVYALILFAAPTPLLTHIGSLSGIASFAGLKAAPAQTVSGHTHIRPLFDHKAKDVCSDAQPGKVKCMAKVAVDSSLKPLDVTANATSTNGPVQFHTAYQLPCKPGGAVASTCSQPSSYSSAPMIAIVDVGNSNGGGKTAEQELAGYDATYGLPDCTVANGCFKEVNETGGSTLPAASGDWYIEIALDVETAHMICQTCRITLVDAAVDTVDYSHLGAAIAQAASYHPVAVSLSLGSTDDGSGQEQAAAAAQDSHLNNVPGTTILAATGDHGSQNTDWPASNPKVLAVSGTTLSLNSDNTWAGETVWNTVFDSTKGVYDGTGGGCSKYYSAGSWQTSHAGWSSLSCGTKRSMGDVSSDGDPSSGAFVYISSSEQYRVGGTSLATPLVAGIIGLSGTQASSSAMSSIPYSAPSASFRDITSGNNCVSGVTGGLCTAKAGFDTPSGLGSLVGVRAFSQGPTTPGTLHSTASTTTSITLAWTASTSASSTISGYHIYRNNTLIATQTATSYADSGLTSGTAYNYQVEAYDALGNTSARASASLHTVDTTPPTTSISSNPGSPSNNLSAKFTFTGTDNLTPAGSLTFTCKLDSAAYSACTSPLTYTNLSLGSHTFTVRAADAASNVDASPATYTWTADNHTPLYRLWDPRTNDHMETTNATERAWAINTVGYRDEGVSGYILTSQSSGSTPLYRLWDPRSNDHMETTNATERAWALNTVGYRDEGTIGYIATASGTGTTPFYRLWLPRNNDHMETTNATERTWALNTVGYRDEKTTGYLYTSQ